jgi:hypothetical protein
MDERTLVRTMSERAKVRPSAFEDLTRRRQRSRRNRRVGSAAVTLTVIGALAWATLSLAHLGGGARPVEPSPDSTFLPAPGEGWHVATASGITVDVPPGWSLVQIGGSVEGEDPASAWPSMEIANFEPALDPDHLCPSTSVQRDLPADGAVLFVVRNEPPLASVPYPEYPPRLAQFDERLGPCGQGAWAHWRVGDRYFEGGAIIGTDVSKTDLYSVLTTLRNLRFDHIDAQDRMHESLLHHRLQWFTSDPEDRDELAKWNALRFGPRLSLEDVSGHQNGTLQVLHDPGDLMAGQEPAFVLQLFEGAIFGLPSVVKNPPLLIRTSSRDLGDGQFETTLFGLFSEGTARVVAEVPGGDPIEAQLHVVTGLGATLRFFAVDFGDVTPGMRLVALDANGEPIGGEDVHPVPSPRTTVNGAPDSGASSKAG